MKKKIFSMKSLGVVAMAAFVAVAVTAPDAFAGTTDVEFTALATKLTDWLGGYLGKTIAGMALLLGLGGAAVSGKLIPATIGIGVAFFAAFGPAVIGLTGATGLLTAII